MVPEQEVGYSFCLSVCCFPFNALCRTRCGTRTWGGLRLPFVCLFDVSPLMPCLVQVKTWYQNRWATALVCLSVCLSVVPHLMPCADQDVVLEQVGHSFGLPVCLSACLSVCLSVVPHLTPCADQDVVPEQKMGQSFGRSVCCSAFNALCRSRRDTRTGGPQLWSVCLFVCLFVCLSVCCSAVNALCRSGSGTRTENGPKLWSVCLLFPFYCLASCR